MLRQRARDGKRNRSALYYYNNNKVLVRYGIGSNKSQNSAQGAIASKYTEQHKHFFVLAVYEETRLSDAKYK